jgi:hypothetical protein
VGAHRVYLELLVGEMTISKINQITQFFFFATEEVGNFYCKKNEHKKVSSN